MTQTLIKTVTVLKKYQFKWHIEFQINIHNFKYRTLKIRMERDVLWLKQVEGVKLLSYEGKAKCEKDKEKNHIISTSKSHIACVPTKLRIMAQRACLEYFTSPPLSVFSCVVHYVCGYCYLAGQSNDVLRKTFKHQTGFCTIPKSPLFANCIWSNPWIIFPNANCLQCLHLVQTQRGAIRKVRVVWKSQYC